MTAKYNITKVAALGDERFKELVTKHLARSDGDPALWEVLLGETLINRTTETLKDMFEVACAAAAKRANERNEIRVACLERGPSGRTEWLHSDAKYQLWKSRNSHFKKLVQTRLTEAREARRDHVLSGRAVKKTNRDDRLVAHARQMTDERNHHVGVIREFARMVQRHQAMTAASGRMPEQHDYDLWRLLDELSMPDGAERDLIPLRQMLQAFWYDTTPATLAEGVRGQTERMMRQAPAGRSPRYEGTPKVRRIDEPKRLA
ncbi:hypothetical protein ACFZC6_01815 [Streptomyces ossamyceticus]|uniref:hypothetical protein n=1 Tax=Streptomyces ossamyceticus TaxID=249581 RepID=UPI0036EE9617